MTLTEYRQHLRHTLAECGVDNLVISFMLKTAAFPELSRIAAQLCWVNSLPAHKEICTTAVRIYLRVLAREGEYVFDDEPKKEFWEERPVSEAGDPHPEDHECDCGLCEAYEDG